MTHNITVQPNDDGIRPASLPGQCFYCKQQVGQPHSQDCVTVKRMVMVRFTVDIPVEVPAYWDASNIEFYYGEGSWCADNLIEMLQEGAGRVGCLCGHVESVYLRDISTEPYGKLQDPTNDPNL